MKNTSVDNLKKAMINLLEEKMYTRISVQNLIKEANIGRQTFYNHYQTKDDLLKAMIEEEKTYFKTAIIKNRKNWMSEDSLINLIAELEPHSKNILILLDVKPELPFNSKNLYEEMIIVLREWTQFLRNDLNISHKDTEFASYIHAHTALKFITYSLKNKFDIDNCKLIHTLFLASISYFNDDNSKSDSLSIN